MTKTLPFINKFIKEKGVLILLFFVTFLVYVHNISPDVYGGDSGDFLTAAFVHGVPHPSGYPLYTIIGILFLKLPIAASAAWKMGLISAIFSSLGIIFIYLICFRLTKNKIISIISALTLAFVYPYWLYAEVVEVFALHNFFVIILTYLTFEYIYSHKLKYVYLLAFFTGLSLTNNLAIVLIFPAILLALLFNKFTRLLNIKIISKCLLLFLLGLAPYIYIPIAAAHNPVLNWGVAVNLRNFWDLVSRKQYGWGATLTNFNQMTSVVNFFLIYQYFIKVLNPFVSLIALFGLGMLFKKKRYLIFSILLGLIIITGPFYVYYSRTELKNFGTLYVMERFFNVPIIFLIILFSQGTSSMIKLFPKLLHSKFLKDFTVLISLITFMVIPLASFASNYPKTNLSNVYLGRNFAEDLVGNLPKNSIVFLGDDTAALTSIYYKYVLGHRNDILMPGRGGDKLPLLIATGMSSKDAQQYLTENQNAIDAKTLKTAIYNLMGKSGIYTDIPVEVELAGKKKIVPVPNGILFKLQFEDKVEPENEYLTHANYILGKFHINELKQNKDLIQNNFIFTHILNAYFNGYYNTVYYLTNTYNDNDNSTIILQKAHKLDAYFSN